MATLARWLPPAIAVGPMLALMAAFASPQHGVAVAGVASGCPSLPIDVAWSLLLRCSSAVPSSRFGPFLPLFLPQDLPLPVLTEAASPSLWTVIYVQMICLPVFDETLTGCPCLLPWFVAVPAISGAFFNLFLIPSKCDDIAPFQEFSQDVRFGGVNLFFPFPFTNLYG